jgi:hypothetical protein
MLSSGYAILYRKGKRYVYRAIFLLNKLRIRQKVLDHSGDPNMIKDAGLDPVLRQNVASHNVYVTKRNCYLT